MWVVKGYLVVWGLLGYLVVFPPTHTSSTFLIKPLESAWLFKVLTTLFLWLHHIIKNLKLFSII